MRYINDYEDLSNVKWQITKIALLFPEKRWIQWTWMQSPLT